MPDASPSPPSVFDPPDCYTRQEQMRELPRMLMEGTHELHRNCRHWLPPWEEEETRAPIGGLSDYEIRVQRSVVEPFYQRAVKRAVATCLGKAVVLKPDVPVEIRGTDAQQRDGWWENIDLRGNDGNVFLRAVLDDAMGDAGQSAVLVDHPPVPDGFKLSDVQAAKMRPFWRHYKARDVWADEEDAEVVNGRERTRRVRLRERGPKGEERIRELIAAPWNEATQSFVGFVTWTLWEQQKGDDGKPVDAVIGQGTMEPHQEIPLQVLYLDRTGFFEARLPFEHLAHLNLKHIREQSDIAEDLRISSGAVLHRAGAVGDEAKQRVTGGKRLLASSDPNAKAEWLERSGSATEKYLAYEDDLEAKMERLGNEPHIRRTGTETATATAIDAAKATTEIQVQVIALRDFVESLLTLTAKYPPISSDKGGSVDIKTPPRYSQQTIEQIQVLQKAADASYVQRFRVPEALVSLGILPDDVDPVVESELAKAAQPFPVPTVRITESTTPTAAGAGGAAPMSPQERVRQAIASRLPAAAAAAPVAPPEPVPPAPTAAALNAAGG